MSTILRWTSSARALREIKRHLKVITAADFNQSVRDWDWSGHIAPDTKIHASCGCRVCTGARFNMKV